MSDERLSSNEGGRKVRIARTRARLIGPQLHTER
jgi:hypothetical protein